MKEVKGSESTEVVFEDLGRDSEVVVFHDAAFLNCASELSWNQRRPTTDCSLVKRRS